MTETGKPSRLCEWMGKWGFRLAIFAVMSLFVYGMVHILVVWGYIWPTPAANFATEGGSDALHIADALRTPPGHLSPGGFWWGLYHWQTLIAGALAIGTAFVGGRAIYRSALKQIESDRKVAIRRERIENLHLARSIYTELAQNEFEIDFFIKNVSMYKDAATRGSIIKRSYASGSHIPVDEYEYQIFPSVIFTIFEAVVSRVGTLPLEVGRRVIVAYSRMNHIKEYKRKMDPDLVLQIIDKNVDLCITISSIIKETNKFLIVHIAALEVNIEKI